MAKRRESVRPSVSIPRKFTPISLAALRLFAQVGVLFVGVSSGLAQTSTQQYVYLSLPGSPPASPSSLISELSKAGQTGALSTAPRRSRQLPTAQFLLFSLPLPPASATQSSPLRMMLRARHKQS